MEVFDVRHWLERYRRGSVSVAKFGTPTWTGACYTKYSKDGDSRFVVGDKTGLVPVRHPPLPYDLGHGFEPEEEDAAAVAACKKANAEGRAYKEEDRMKEPLRMLEAMKQADMDIEEFDIVSIRKCLVMMAMTAVETDKAWSLHACSISSLPKAMLMDFNGKGDAIVDGKTIQHDFGDNTKFSLYGEQFEKVFREELKTTSEGQAEAFYMIAETDINEMKCAVMGTISCFDPSLGARPDEPDLDALIQMRSRKQPTRPGQHLRAKTSKYPSWWMQSYIVGIRHIHVGNWTPEGLLMHVERIQTDELPQKAKEGVRGELGRKMWTPAIMMEFLHSVLEWMQSIVQTDRDIIYRFTYDPVKKTVEGNPLTGDVSMLLDALM